MADGRTLKERILTMLSLGAFYSNFKAKDAMLHDLIERHMREEVHMFRKIVEAAKEDAAEDISSKISSYLEDLQKTKTLCRLGWSFRYMPSALPSSKRNLIVPGL